MAFVKLNLNHIRYRVHTNCFGNLVSNRSTHG